MLKDMRLQRGLSQAQLSIISGVNLRTLQQYEQGTRKVDGASLNTLLSFCTVLQCDIPDILTDKDLIKKYKEHTKNTLV